MPRPLNVEKLEKKFLSLTRSRESIQGLSSWIMHHPEYCPEIVEEWLSALMKADCNALSMFFVANDVILHCGKKKVPEYREAFSTVLKKAVSLAKVKEVKIDVNRMLTLWHEKEIYDNDFFKNLHDILNSATSEDSKESDIEEDVSSESEIISKYKLQKLVDSVQNLKKMNEEVHNKERKFKNMKEPEILNLDSLIVRMDRSDSQKQLQRADVYYKYLESLIASINMLNKTRENVLKHLRYASVFYAVQNDEVKKVAQAYRIYGKKLKIMEKSLSTKVLELREQFPSPIQESPVYDPTIETYSSPKSPTDNSKHVVNVFSDSQSSVSPSNSIVEKTDSTPQDLKECHENEESMEESAINPLLMDESIVDSKKDTESSHSDVASEKVQDLNPENELILNELENETEIKVEKPNDGLFSEVDFLLEKGYDNRQVKQKSNIKRKIETLLKSKAAKTSKLSPSETQTDEFPTELVDSTGVKEEHVCDDSSKENSAITDLKSEDTVSSHVVCSETLSESKNEIVKDDLPLKDDKEQISEEAIAPVEKLCLQENLPVNDVGLDIEPITKLSANLFTDIPTELLKNILNKSKINVSLTPEKTDTIDEKESQNPGDICLESEATDSKQTEESEKCLSDSKLIADFDEKCDELIDSKSDKICSSPTKESTKLDANNSEESDDVKNVQECKNSESSNLDSSGTLKFLDVLQETFQCITEQFSSPKSKDISENSSLDIPFENYLKMYSFLLNCDQTSPGNKKEIANKLNQNESTLHDSMDPNLNTSTINNSNCKRDSDLSKVSSNEEKMSASTKENSKFDNLEVMDMEVDSDDELMKM